MDTMMTTPMHLCWPYGLCEPAQVGKESPSTVEENSKGQETQRTESGERSDEKRSD